MNALAVYLVPFLITDSTCYLQRSNTAKYLTAGTCFSSYFNRRFLQYSNYFIDFSQHCGFFLCFYFLSFFQLAEIRRISFYCQLSRDKIVASVTVFYSSLFV